MSLSSFLSLLLIALLVVRPVPAQNLANAAPLVITVVNKDGGMTAPGSRAQKGFSVQIADGSGTPVSDAAVVLRFPDSGATATFTDGTHAGVAYTDATGRADVSGMQWSTEPGTVAIKITATKGTAHAGTIIEQQIGEEPKVSTTQSPTQTTTPENSVASQPNPTAAASSQPAEPKLSVEQTAAARGTTEPMPQPGLPRPTERIPAPLPSTAATPSISVINRPSNEKLDSGGGHKKWIILLIAVAAGAGAGIALAGKKGSSSSSSNTSISTGTTIGSPTVNVGAP